LVVFWFLGGWSRGACEEGGPLVCLGELLGAPCVNGWT
jgi:hypothetical protein